jgi:hypothetical protein
VQVGHRGRVAAAERGHDRGVGKLVAFAVGVQAGAEDLGLLVGDHGAVGAAARGLDGVGGAQRGGGVALADDVAKIGVA